MHTENNDGLTDRSLFKCNLAGMPLTDWIQDALQKEAATLLDEYNLARKTSASILKSSSFKGFKQNRDKNRYRDVPCHDQTRVFLNDGQEGDYIHASTVEGVCRTYICAQGPTARTAYDFWRMVWQEEILIIVMLCQKMEAKQEKCFGYWAETENSTKTFKNFQVKTVGLSKNNEFNETRLELTDEQQKTRTILHIGFYTWPDRGQPGSEMALVRLHSILEVTRDRIASENGIDRPRELVHCSAGIGRTGTLVVFIICIEFLTNSNNTELPSVAEVLTHVRRCRPFSVQTNGQYICIYAAIIEYLKFHGLIATDQHIRLTERFQHMTEVISKINTRNRSMRNAKK